MDVVEDWKGYFTYLSSFLKECTQQSETTDSDKVSYFCERLECFTRNTDRLLNIVSSSLSQSTEGVNLRQCATLATSLKNLVVSMRDFWLPYWQSRKENLNGSFVYHALSDHVQAIRTGLCVIFYVVCMTERFVVHREKRQT